MSSWRKTIPSLSESVFPGISLFSSSSEASYKFQTLANLPLQVVLYYNVWFYPVWLITTGVMLSSKISCLLNLYKFIIVTVVVSIACIEILRLYLGYFGNLYENIPEVAAFWMLSVLLQLPLQTFLTANRQFALQPIEYTVQGIMLVMLISQLLIGFHALRFAARTQAARFHVMQTQMRMAALSATEIVGLGENWSQ